MLCEELKLLWEHGIKWNGVTWRVAVINGIWDGKGFESVTKTMGSNSAHGCNVCNFPGIYFAGAERYPFYSRYTARNDPRRLQRPTAEVSHWRKMWNVKPDNNPIPKKRTYQEYIEAARKVENNTITASSVGINGVWIPDCLSYSHLIYWTKDIMHSANNSIKNSVAVMKPTRTSKPYAHINRTQSDSCRKSCQQYRVFPFLYQTEPTYPWIMTVAELLIHDKRFEHVLGAKSIEIPKNFMKYGKNGNSHDTIMYAINGWAAWGLFNSNFITTPLKVIDDYVDSKLRLYNCISNLFSGRIKKSALDLMKQEIRDTLIEHAALFPPTESTHALHELIHCTDQIEELGPPRHNSLFMFERMNGHLKRMVQNKSCPMASIVKAYEKEEFITQTLGYNFKRLSSVVNSMALVPSNYNIVKK